MIPAERLLDVFVEIADTLVDDFDLVVFLHQLAEHSATISGAATASLLLAQDDGRLQFMASLAAEHEALARFQLESQEGPCLDCFHTGEQVAVTDLQQSADRWPLFAERARQVGIQSFYAFPMRLRDQVIGVLAVWGTTVAPLPDEDVRAVQAIADVATIAILQERSVRAAEVLSTQLQSALDTRIVIEQAKGAVARTLDWTVDAAFVRMRDHARSHRLRLSELARAVVAGELDPHVLADDRG